jgi:antitoxin PrlF
MEIEAAVSEGGQTTIPPATRGLLRVDWRSSVLFRATEDGNVMLAAKSTSADEPDPVVTSFLTFLEADMARQPARLHPVTRAWLHEIRILVAGVAVDLDAVLPEEPV